LRPDNGAAHARLGDLFESLGRTAEAITQLEAAQRAYPDPARAKMLDHLLAQKR
jgi:hypothetical protein